MDRLDDDAIRRELEGLPEWEREGEAIRKTVKLADFRAAIAYVNRIAEVAEALNHHPDIAIHWNTVTLTVWTHSVGGLTARDIELARRIDAL